MAVAITLHSFLSLWQQPQILLLIPSFSDTDLYGSSHHHLALGLLPARRRVVLARRLLLREWGSERTLLFRGAGRKREVVPGGVEGSGCLWERNEEEDKEEVEVQPAGHTPDELDLSPRLAW